jgi:hypothetical protein
MNALMGILSQVAKSRLVRNAERLIATLDNLHADVNALMIVVPFGAAPRVCPHDLRLVTWRPYKIIGPRSSPIRRYIDQRVNLSGSPIAQRLAHDGGRRNFLPAGGGLDCGPHIGRYLNCQSL